MEPPSEILSDTEPTARSLLIDWTNKQDHWIRALVSEVIETRAEVSEERAKWFYDLFLREKELRDGDPVDVPELSHGQSEATAGDTLTLQFLDSVQNVNALARQQRIDFNPHLTVVFGENAAGKTGYVRILKRIAAVRTAEPILPDVGKINALGKPGARIGFTLGPKADTVCWEDEAGVYPFTRMDVFDARSAAIHVDTDLTYIYTPGELSRFPLVRRGIDRVRALSEAEIRALSTLPNPFTVQFDRKSRIYTKIENLGASTQLAELREISKVTQAEEDDAASLRTQIEALKSSTPRAHLTLADTDKQFLDRALRLVKIVSGFDLAEYAAALGEFSAASLRYEQATKSSFAGVTIPGILQDEWRRFIQAGEDYLQAIAAADAYPAAEERCIYCQQPLGTAAVDLLRKYREYCKNELRASVTSADLRITALTEPITGLEIEAILKNSTAYIKAKSQNGAVPILPTLAVLLPKVAALKSALAKREAQSWPGLRDEAAAARQAIEEEVERTKQLIADLTIQSSNRDQTLKDRESKLLDISSRLRLRDLLPQIEEYVGRAQWVDKAKNHAKRFQGILRTLTDTSKVASEKLLNLDFERRFQAECELLRAPTVKLEFPGKEGQVTRHKALAPNHRLSEILSEGEQKVIALADFLAELGLKQPLAPVVFDDPITSLDYKRTAEVAERIVALSEARQIIVFTHNILFTVDLLSRVEKQKERYVYYDIKREGDLRGIVSQGTHPRDDSFNSLRGTINTLIQAADKESGAAQAALIAAGYESLRAICEVIVERELLQGVTERYSPMVRVTMLPKIRFDRLEAAVGVITEVYDRCSRSIRSHSQPLETLNVQPAVSDLRKDWQTVEDARNAYLGNKGKS
jgi:hypothetical protein